MSAAAFKTRFAPSPTGLLHLGNMRTALFNVLLARQRSGTFMLRIEDTDLGRSSEEYANALMQDLRWLLLDWQEGPGRERPGHAPYFQSQRGGIYARYFAELEDRVLAYPCFCSDQELKLARKTALAAGRPPRYSGRCRSLSKTEATQRLARGEPASLRFKVPTGVMIEFEDRVRGQQRFASDDIGDFVIRRSDGTPAFFFSNAIDDALMEVTLVLRGEDHLANTPRQILLLQSLGLRVPEYGHIALVVGADGAPLSKRHGSRTVQELRTSGFFPLAINNYLARVGHSYESNAFMDMESLSAGFDLGRAGRAAARYDDAQLLYWQREAITCASHQELWAWMGEEVSRLVFPDARDAFIDTVRGNISLPEHALFWARTVFTNNWDLSQTAREVIASTDSSFFPAALAALAARADDFKALSEELRERTGFRGKALFQPLRAALTGELDGPEMARLLPLIGAERARTRLETAQRLSGR